MTRDAVTRIGWAKVVLHWFRSSQMANALPSTRRASMTATEDPDARTESLAAGTEAWHQRLHHTPREALSADTAQSPGMQRYEAVSGRLTGSQKIWMGETHVAAGMRSSNHHHGDSETGIY